MSRIATASKLAVWDKEGFFKGYKPLCYQKYTNAGYLFKLPVGNKIP